VHNESKGSKGIFYMLLAACCFTVCAFLLKLLYMNSNINTYEFTYWNSIVMGILNLCLFKLNNKDHLLVRDDMRTTLVLRSICAFIGATGFYLALQYTDLSKATVLYWTNPMMTAMLSYFWINEALSFVDWLAIFVSFAGILVIQNPWEKFANTGRSMDDTMGAIAALVGAVFYAIAQMQTRKMGKKVHFLITPLYQAVFSAFIAPLLMIVFLRYRTAHTTLYGWYEIVMIIIISVFMFAT
jgi:drug/metabolite transporter (DMT)-like permease